MTIEIKNIKNILLDLGGVICDLDWQAMKVAFEKLSSLTEAGNQRAQELDLYIKFETGLFSEDEFISKVIDLLGNQNTEEQVVNAWNSILVMVPQERLDAIKELDKKFSLFLLSNTNIIHHRYINEVLMANNSPRQIEDLFEHCFMSYEMNCRKPDPEIFLKVLSSINCKPHEILFIDDDLKNIQSAEKLGMQAYYLNLEEEDLLKALMKLHLI